MNVSTSINPPISRLTNRKYSKGITVPRCCTIMVATNGHVDRLSILSWLLAFALWAPGSPMARFTTDKAAAIFVLALTLVILLLLEVGGLYHILSLELVGVLLHHIGA